MKNFEVLDTKINYYNKGNEDYISLTDMLKSKDGDFFNEGNFMQFNKKI